MNVLDFLFLFYLVLLIPYLSLKSNAKAAQAGTPLPPKYKILTATIINLVILGLFALYTAWARGTRLFEPWHPKPAEIGLGVCLLIFWFSMRNVLREWIRRGRNRLTGRLLPRRWDELPIWALVSLCAGVCEEIVYRGVLFSLVGEFTGSLAIAIIISSLVFGIVHCGQGWQAVAFITVLAASMHGLVLFAGSLYMATIVHTAYDFMAGVQTILRTQAGIDPLPQTDVTPAEPG